jgi:hypothetical protein
LELGDRAQRRDEQVEFLAAVVVDAIYRVVSLSEYVVDGDGQGGDGRVEQLQPEDTKRPPVRWS